jgi:hypothetical protein
MDTHDTRRLLQLAAAMEIQNLKMEYAQLCDAGYDGPSLGRLFTEDAVWDGGDAFGRYEGRREIEGFFSGLGAEITWALHYMIGPRITNVSDAGTSAEGVWYLWMPFIGRDGDASRQMLLTAKQYDRYVRAADGRWQFAEIRVAVETMGPREDGWARDQLPTGGAA